MLDFNAEAGHHVSSRQRVVPLRRSLSKMVFDMAISMLLLVPLFVAAACLLVLNPFFNSGPLLFRQKRMGQNCLPFTAYKFRTMLPCDGTKRGAFDTLEHARITRFGRILRRMRIDELPQIINVLRGEMSLIGPRPDSYDHAQVYLRQIPNYAMRHRIIPGISGFAQIKVGYVDGRDGIKHKVEADLFYLKNASFRFDMWITWRTLCVVLGAKGA